jgi:hypothetical protein
MIGASNDKERSGAGGLRLRLRANISYPWMIHPCLPLDENIPYVEGTYRHNLGPSIDIPNIGTGEHMIGKRYIE